jgi:glycosyltransferase involved in cell wall biosynthesis
MRVHFLGNVVNNHYVLVKAMRRHGIDARLFYEGDGLKQNRPESEDPGVAVERPDWLRPFRRQFQPWQQRDRVSPELLREIGQCDILHAHGVELVWAARTGKPFVWHPFGVDLSAWTTYNADSLMRWRPWPPLPTPPHFLLPPRMRDAARRASAIAIGWHNNVWRRGYRVLRDLGLERRVVRAHLGIDVEKFAPADKEAALAQLLPGRIIERPVIFHPTRQMFRNPGSRRGYKANDRLYRALARLAREGAKFTLILVDRGVLDDAEAKRMLGALGIADRTIWVDEMPRHRLIPWYHAADITAESFYSGAIGSVPLESMACGTSVLMHLQREVSPEDQGIFYDPKGLYPVLPPLIEASTEDEIYRALRDNLAAPSRLAQIGRAGRDWVVTYSSADAVARRFESIYEAVLSGAFRAGTASPGTHLSEIGDTA